MTRTTTVRLLMMAIFLSINVPPGAAAQSTDSVPLAVDLSEPLCAIDLSLVRGNLGSWEWNGAGYTETSGGATVRILGSFTAVPFDGRCDATFSFAGLRGTDGTIPSSRFSAVWFFPWGASGHPDGKTFSNIQVGGFVPAVHFDFDLTLNSIPATLPPGHYTGSLAVTVTNAA